MHNKLLWVAWLIVFICLIDRLAIWFSAWRRGGDHTKRGTTAPLPFSIPRAPTQWKHKSSILCLQSIPADIRPWKAAVFAIHGSAWLTLYKIEIYSLRWDLEYLVFAYNNNVHRAFNSLEMTQDQQAPNLLGQTLKWMKVFTYVHHGWWTKRCSAWMHVQRCYVEYTWRNWRIRLLAAPWGSKGLLACNAPWVPATNNLKCTWPHLFQRGITRTSYSIIPFGFSMAPYSAKHSTTKFAWATNHIKCTWAHLPIT